MWIAKPFAAGGLVCLVACGRTVNAGSAATFTVAASEPAGYQSDRNGQPIVGATSTSYT